MARTQRLPSPCSGPWCANVPQVHQYSEASARKMRLVVSLRTPSPVADQLTAPAMRTLSRSDHEPAQRRGLLCRPSLSHPRARSQVHAAHSARSPCTRSIHRRPSRDRFFRVTAVPYPELHGLPWAVGRTVAWGGRAALDTRPASPLPARPPLLRCMVGWAQSERARSRVLCSSSGRAGREPCSAGHAALAAPGVNAVATQCARAPKARVHRPGAQGAAAISA
jgi:hypothetical protein